MSLFLLLSPSLQRMGHRANIKPKFSDRSLQLWFLRPTALITGWCGSGDVIVLSLLRWVDMSAWFWSLWFHQCHVAVTRWGPLTPVSTSLDRVPIWDGKLLQKFLPLPSYALYPYNSHKARCKVGRQNRDRTGPVVDIRAVVEAPRASSQIKAMHSLRQWDIVSLPPSIKPPIQPPWMRKWSWMSKEALFTVPP